MSCQWKNPNFWVTPEDFNLDEKYPANFNLYFLKVTKGQPWQLRIRDDRFNGPYYPRTSASYSNLFRRDSSIQYKADRGTWIFCLGESRNSTALAEIDLGLTPEQMLDVDYICTRVKCKVTKATLMICFGPSESSGYSYRDWLTSTNAEKVFVTSAGSRQRASHQALQDARGEYICFKWPPCSTGSTVFRHTRKPVTVTLEFTEGLDGLVAMLKIDGQNIEFQTQEQNKRNLSTLKSGENFIQLQWGIDSEPEHVPGALASQPIFVPDPRLAVQTPRAVVPDPRLAVQPQRVVVPDPRLAAAAPSRSVAVAETSSAQVERKAVSSGSDSDSSCASKGRRTRRYRDTSSDSSDSTGWSQVRREPATQVEFADSSSDEESEDDGPEEPSVESLANVQPPLKAELYEILSARDLEKTTRQVARRLLEKKKGMAEDSLRDMRKEISDWCEEYVKISDRRRRPRAELNRREPPK